MAAPHRLDPRRMSAGKGATFGRAMSIWSVSDFRSRGKPAIDMTEFLEEVHALVVMVEKLERYPT